MKKILFALCLFFASFSAFAALTPAQYALLKNSIIADTSITSPITDVDASYAIADAYNLMDVSDWYVWKSSVSVDDIFDSITWANFTPQDAPDGTQAWANRALACQGKQFNVQTMLSGRNSINSAKASIRAGLQDALTGIPSGASGANKQGGWSTLLTILYRKTTRFEKLMSTGTGTIAVPALMGAEGKVSPADVYIARNS